MIAIEKRGKRIEIRADEPLPGLKTTVPGAYQTAAGHWTVPLSLESCKLLRQKYGRRLQLGNELRRWARGVVESREYMSELAQADDAELELLPKVAPKLFAAMDARTYQRVGVRFVADNTATLIADDPGLGKTLIAMGGILEADIPGPYIVVAPKTAADTVWRREILRWLPEGHRPITMPEQGYQRSHKLRLTRFGPKTWLIVHPEMVCVQSWWECVELIPTDEPELDDEGQEIWIPISEDSDELIQVMKEVPCGVRTTEGTKQQRQLNCGHIKTRQTKKIIEPRFPQLFDREWGAIIVDESHESLIRRKTGKLTQRRRGLDMLKLRGDGIRLAMSGTPCDSKPHQLWGTLNWLDSGTYSAFHRWAELYWQKGGYTGFEIGEFRQDREQMLWDSLSAVALRRTKAEVAPDLPAKTYVGSPLVPQDENSPVGVWLEMDGPQARAYSEMETLSIAALDSGDLEAVSSLALLTRLKQLACSYGDVVPVQNADPYEYAFKYQPRLPSNKFNWIVENLEEWGYPREPLTKVVIVSFYTQILEVFRQGVEKHFKTKPDAPLCTAITGRTPSHKRRAVIDQFNKADGPQIMFLNVKAGGTAITLDTADRMIFISQTRIPDQQLQAEDRIHRISNPRQCMYYYLNTLGTVDVGTAVVNEDMKRDTHRLLDERRGVAYMRQVMELSH